MINGEFFLFGLRGSHSFSTSRTKKNTTLLVAKELSILLSSQNQTKTTCLSWTLPRLTSRPPGVKFLSVIARPSLSQLLIIYQWKTLVLTVTLFYNQWNWIPVGYTWLPNRLARISIVWLHLGFRLTPT
jgi:hypothetical protein